MNRPVIICHMMSSVDGRIDCAMTSKIAGVDEYYKTLDALKAEAFLSGRVTGELELAEAGKFTAKDQRPLGHPAFSKKTAAADYEVVVDTLGTLLWKKDAAYDAPHIIITSERVTQEYLAYLDGQGISWIACGAEKINLAGVMEILKKEFAVDRLAVVGGAHINGAFLEAGLLDEISLLIGLGIDGREGMPGVLDGRAMDTEPVRLSLISVESFKDGAVWLRYKVEKN